MPPLMITEDEVDWLIDTTVEALAVVSVPDAARARRRRAGAARGVSVGRGVGRPGRPTRASPVLGYGEITLGARLARTTVRPWPRKRLAGVPATPSPGRRPTAGWSSEYLEQLARRAACSVPSAAAHHVTDAGLGLAVGRATCVQPIAGVGRRSAPHVLAGASPTPRDAAVRPGSLDRVGRARSTGTRRPGRRSCPTGPTRRRRAGLLRRDHPDAQRRRRRDRDWTCACCTAPLPAAAAPARAALRRPRHRRAKYHQPRDVARRPGRQPVQGAAGAPGWPVAGRSWRTSTIDAPDHRRRGAAGTTAPTPSPGRCCCACAGPTSWWQRRVRRRSYPFLLPEPTER